MAQITIATNNHTNSSRISSREVGLESSTDVISESDVRNSELNIDDISDRIEDLNIDSQRNIEDELDDDKMQIIAMIMSIRAVDPQLKVGDVNNDLIIQDGPLDGKCFFRSYIKSKRYNIDRTNLGYNPDIDEVIVFLKKLIVKYYDIHGESIKIDDFLLKISIIAEHDSIENWKRNILNDPKYWGGDIEMILLSEIFNDHIKCVSRSGSRFNHDYGKENEEKILMTLKDNHYKSILMF
jgi:hypothetical protein